MAADDDGVPDLEDCSDLVRQCFTTQSNGSEANSSGAITEITTLGPVIAPTVEIAETNVNAPPKDSATTEKGTSSFGGMKKGFLLGSNSKTKKSVEAVPYIKRAAENEKKSLVMQEVQQQLIDKKSEWLTDDLLQTIQKSDDNFMDMFSNPEFAVVLAEFQKNPQQAMLKYKDNKTIMGFFNKFAQIMGEHFTKLGSKTM